jgi:hypothetical protein
VQDKESAEKLIGCYVFDSVSNKGVTTNAFGYFNITQNEGELQNSRTLPWLC